MNPIPLSHRRASAPARLRRLVATLSNAVVLACAVGAASPASAFEIPSDIKPYVAKPLTLPADYRAYMVDKDTIYVAGNDVLIPLFDKLQERFKELHPNIKFKFLMWGSTLSVEGLVSGKSAFGPIGRENRRAEADYFRERFGYDVTYFKIGYDHNPNDKLSTGIWVNSTNPIKQLTKDQVKRIFSAGNGKGDITHWRQLGVMEAEWADLPIHAYMPRDTQGILAMIDEFRDFIGGVSYTPRIEWLPNGNKVIDAVAQDAFSMGLMDYWNNALEMRGVTKWKRMDEFATRVKFVPVSWDEKTPPSDGTLTGTRHPFASPIGIDINREPGKPLDPWLKAYCEFLVSRDAQDIINSPAMAKFGFRPLEAGDVAIQLKKIE